MARFLGVRLIQALVALFFLSILIFAAAHAAGNPADTLLPLTATAPERALFVHQYGLDRALPVQYLVYMGHLFKGNFGTSVALQVPVSTLVRDRAPASLLLAAVATAGAFVASVVLGALGALNRGGKLDTAVLGISMVCQSMPVFWVGIVFIELFAVRFRLFPPGGFTTAASLVLPATVLALFGFGSLVRLFRTSVIDAMLLEHVTFARLKGMSNRRVIFRHVLRNALMPVITASGLYFAGLFSMAYALEAVFDWPGLGQLGFSAIQSHDYPVLQGVVLVTGVFVILVNLLIDVAHAGLDVRVRT
jgi:peptide/nickel transport system permease protein